MVPAVEEEIRRIPALATDTIDYVATDQTGLTSTSTRTVIIEPAAPSIVPTDDASTTTVAPTSTQ
jgi:hypothetical protein